MGAHYTYAETPLGYWIGELFGMERNMYDRFVHFSFGFLLAYPMREAFIRIARARGLWGYYIPVDITFAFSACYEIFEWLAMAILGESSTLLFLAAQNDIWDAQKDMTAAGIGAILMMLIVIAVNWYYDRDFVYELLDEESRTPEVPIGEQKISHVLNRKKESTLFTDTQ
jgi:putative membrane protein